MRAARPLFVLVTLAAAFACSAVQAGSLADVEVYDRTEGPRTLRARRPLELQTPPIALEQLE